MSICGKLLNILYPPKCIFCGDIISEYEPDKICPYCKNDLVRLSLPSSVFFCYDILRRCIHNFKCRRKYKKYRLASIAVTPKCRPALPFYAKSP